MTNGVWGTLPPSAIKLYGWLLYTGQRISKEAITLTAADLRRAGISINSVATGRNALVSAGLVSVERLRDGFEYRILDPMSKRPLERLTDLEKVNPEVVKMYFQNSLENYDAKEQHYEGMLSRCPFHRETNHKKRTLSVSFQSGGAFKCHGCQLEGGIVAFEQEMARLKGAELNRSQAFNGVKRQLLSFARKHRKRIREELALRRASI